MAMVQRKLQHFNSQPHKEADAKDIAYASPLHYFNSQPHKEADTIPNWGKHQNVDISTHSLTRRLTRLSERLRFLHRDFNSQPHKEADLPQN